MSKRFVYVLRNAEVPPRYYTGITSDVVRRHAEHIHGAEGIKRTFIQDGLRDALQALAAPGDVALALVPDGMVKADELALDFDNFGRAALESLESELTQAQRESLVAVDRVLDAMSGARHRDLGPKKRFARTRSGRSAGSCETRSGGFRLGRGPTEPEATCIRERASQVILRSRLTLLRDYLPGSKRSRHSYGLTRFSGFHTKYRLRSKGFVKLTGSVVVRM